MTLLEALDKGLPLGRMSGSLVAHTRSIYGLDYTANVAPGIPIEVDYFLEYIRLRLHDYKATDWFVLTGDGEAVL